MIKFFKEKKALEKIREKLLLGLKNGILQIVG